MAAKTTTTQTQPWQPAVYPMQQILQGAQNAYNAHPQGTPFYPGQTVAPFSPQTSQGLKMMTAEAGSGQGAHTADLASQNVDRMLSSGGLSAGETGILGRQMQEYNNLNNPLGSDAFRQGQDFAAQKAQDALMGSLSGSGRFGGNGATANAFADEVGGLRMQGLAAEQARQQTARTGLLNDMFGGYQTGQANTLNATQLLPTINTARYADPTHMIQAGSAFDAQHQAIMDSAKERYDTNQAAPWTALQQYSSIVNPIGGAGSTGTTTAPKTSKAGGILGGALAGASAGSSFGPFGTVIGGGLGGILGGIFLMFEDLGSYLSNMFGAGGTGILQGPTAGGGTLDAAQSPGLLNQFQSGVVNHRDALMGMGVGLLNGGDLRSGLAQGFTNFNAGEKEDRKRTSAAAWAKSAKDLTPEQRQLLEDNPDIASAAAAKQIGDIVSPPTTADITEFNYDKTHGYTGTFHEWLMAKKETAGKYYGNPAFWKDAAGNVHAGQWSSRGGLEEVQVPGGGNLMMPTQQIPLGDGTLVTTRLQTAVPTVPTKVNPGGAAAAPAAGGAAAAPATGGSLLAPQPLSTQTPEGVVYKKNIFSQEDQKIQAEARAKAQAALPQAEDAADHFNQLIDELKADPNRAYRIGGHGNISMQTPWSNSAQTYDTKLQQAIGQSFLVAYEGLKGAGQITEGEGAPAKAAISRLQHPEQFTSQDEWDLALDAAKQRMSELKALARRKASAGYVPPGQPTPGAPAGGDYPIIQVR